jgi:DNA-binding NtrC family response regulator
MPGNQHQTETKTVLVVEDEPRVRRFSCRIFASLGYHVLEAENAEIAMGMLVDLHDQIDLVFSDIVMPGNSSGRDLGQHVQSNYKGIEVLLTSGFENTKRTSPPGEQHKELPVLKKPFSKDDLICALGELSA